MIDIKRDNDASVWILSKVTNTDNQVRLTDEEMDDFIRNVHNHIERYGHVKGSYAIKKPDYSFFLISPEEFDAMSEKYEIEMQTKVSQAF